jgi:hypothetical protein
MRTRLSTLATVSRYALSAVCVGVAVAVSACGGANTTAINTQPPVAADVAQFAPGTEVLAPYYPHAPEQTLIDNAREILLARCLKSKGDESAAPYTSDGTAAAAFEREANGVLYGITDSELARKYGYSPSPDRVPVTAPLEAATPAPLPNAPIGGSTNEAVPPGTETDSPQLTACVQAAQSALYGGKQFVGVDPFTLGKTLEIQSWQQSRADPRVKAAWADWRACMAKAGHTPKGGPVDPKLYAVRTDGSQASPSEVSTALTDIECRKTIDYVARWAAVVTELETRALATHQATLNEQRQHLQETLTRAKQITGS